MTRSTVGMQNVWVVRESPLMLPPPQRVTILVREDGFDLLKAHGREVLLVPPQLWSGSLAKPLELCHRDVGVAAWIWTDHDLQTSRLAEALLKIGALFVRKFHAHFSLDRSQAVLLDVSLGDEAAVPARVQRRVAALREHLTHRKRRPAARRHKRGARLVPPDEK